ncbi:MAG: hypothetical protein R2932_17325 [Caldilineaceae bacterium]
MAYSLARIPWRGRNALFIFTVATLMLLLSSDADPALCGLVDLWICQYICPTDCPHWFGSALYIFLLRQFFMTIPMELSEARIDGARIPDLLADHSAALKAALATVAIFEFIARWRDYLGP